MGYPQSAAMIAELEVLLAQLPGIASGSEAVDISSGDHTATMTDCRIVTGIPGDDAATIKLDYTDLDGNSVTGVSLPLRTGVLRVANVTKVYQTGTSNLTSIYLHK